VGSINQVEPLSYAWAAILGLVQGLTEFMPVSSSGHLALAEHFMSGQPEDMAFDILLHVATAGVVLVAFGGDLWRFWCRKKVVLCYLLLGSVPVGIVGVLFRKKIELLREHPQLVCAALLVTALLLFIMEKAKESAVRMEEMGWKRALLVGFFQAIAIVPGISRSGSTISGGVLCGLEREDAVKFSFLLMVPAILGAALLKGIDIIKAGAPVAGFSFGAYGVGFGVACASGYVALRTLLHLVKTKKMIWFAAYCALVAIAGLIYFSGGINGA
jgi:undecaprenyl-diphosphatase